jgi:hypothetical protein
MPIQIEEQNFWFEVRYKSDTIHLVLIDNREVVIHNISSDAKKTKDSNASCWPDSGMNRLRCRQRIFYACRQNIFPDISQKYKMDDIAKEWPTHSSPPKKILKEMFK